VIQFNPILSIGDKVRLVKLKLFLDMSEEGDATLLEKHEGQTGYVTAIAVPGIGDTEQPRYINLRMDCGEVVEAISIYHIRRILNHLESDASLHDVEDEDLWFHMTHSMDFGG